MSLDTLKTLESLRGCQFTPEQAEVMTGILIEREEDLVTKEDFAREMAGIDHRFQDVQRDLDQLRKDMETGFALMERRFAEMEREFARVREDNRRDLEHAMAEQRRFTESVDERAALRNERSQRETQLAMIVIVGVAVAALGLMIAFL